MSALAGVVHHSGSTTRRAAEASRVTTWVASRFHIYARACLLGAIFVAPVALNLGSLNVFMLVKITSMWICGIIALGFWAAWSAERRAWLPPLALGRLAVVFLTIYVAATILSTNPQLSLIGLYARYGGLVPLLLYATVAMMIVGLYWLRPDGVREVAWAISAGTLVVAGYVLIQAAGLDWSRWTDPATGQPPAFPGGTIGNSNFAGGYLALALPWVLATALAPARRSVRIGLLTVLGLTALALWCTQTRGGLIGAAAGMATLAVLYRHRVPRWLRRVAAGGLVGVIGVATLAIWHPGTEKAPGPLDNVHLLATSTLESRVNYWLAAGSMFLDHPVLGVGPDMYFDHYTAHRVESDAVKSGYVVPEKPHNIFFEYAANTGALGLLSYLALVGAALRYGWRRIRSLSGQSRLVLSCVLASTVAYCVQGFFSIDVPTLAVMGWVNLGALAVLADPKVLAAREAVSAPVASNSTEGQAGLPRQRSRWAVLVIRTTIAGTALGLLFVGTLPLRADVIARRGNLARAMAMFPLESSYRSQAGSRALQLADAAQTTGQQREALDRALLRFRQGLHMRPLGLENMLGLARTYTLWARTLDPAQFAEAQVWWKRTIASDPRNVSLRESYEEQVTAQRRVAARLEARLRVQPDRVGDLITLAQTYIGLGEPRRARSPLETALRLEPMNNQAQELLERVRASGP